MRSTRMLVIALAATLLSAGAVSAAPPTPARATGALVEPALLSELAAATGPVVAIATVEPRQQRAVARRLQAEGLSVLVFEHLPFVGVRGAVEDLRGATDVPGLLRLSANAPVEPALNSTLPAARIDAAQRTGLTGRGVGIAVVDSGIDNMHPDLRGAVRENVKVLADDDAVWQLTHGVGGRRPAALPAVASVIVPADSNDREGHGTHVAGTAAGRGTSSAGRYVGAAPGAHLLGVGIGDGGAVLWVLGAFEHVLERREALDIQVLNASFQTTPTPDDTLFPYDPDAPVNVASRALHAAGVAVVFAAGNFGPEQDSMNAYSVWPWVLAVGNVCVTGKPSAFMNCSRVSRDRTVALSDSSARGVPGDPLKRPDLVAPGMYVVAPRAAASDPGLEPDFDVLGTCGARGEQDLLGYRCRSGTSMSAPHVSGVLALMEEAAGRDLTPDELMRLVTSSARSLRPFAPWEVGAGMLDGLAAVEAARALTAPTKRPCEPGHPGRGAGRACR